MSGKDKNKIYQKLLALRNATDELLKELEEDQPCPAPRQRQNRRESRIINFDARYNKKKYQ
jgi:hypothetical protein